MSLARGNSCLSCTYQTAPVNYNPNMNFSTAFFYWWLLALFMPIMGQHYDCHLPFPRYPLSVNSLQSSFTFCTHFYLLGLASDYQRPTTDDRRLTTMPDTKSLDHPLAPSASAAAMRQLWETVSPSFLANELHNKQVPGVLHFCSFLSFRRAVRAHENYRHFHLLL